MPSLCRLHDPAVRLPLLPPAVQDAWWELAAAYDDRTLLTALARRPDRSAHVTAAAARHPRAVVRAARPRMHPVAERVHGRWPYGCALDPGSSGRPKVTSRDHEVWATVTACHVDELPDWIDTLRTEPDRDPRTNWGTDDLKVAAAIARRRDFPAELAGALAPHLTRRAASPLFRRLRARGPYDPCTPAGRSVLAFTARLYGVDPAALRDMFAHAHAAAAALLPEASRFAQPRGVTSLAQPAVDASRLLAQRELEAVVTSGLLTGEDVVALPIGGCLPDGPAPRSFHETIQPVLQQVVGADSGAWERALTVAERQPDLPLLAAAAICARPGAPCQVVGR